MRLSSDGETTVKSWMGSLCTMLMLAVLSGFTYQKVGILIDRKDVDILSSLNVAYFGSDEKFGNKQGFNVAVALDGSLDPSIGEIVYTKYDWGFDSDGKYYIAARRLESYPCSKAELGLDQGRLSEAKFMPIHKNSQSTLK